MSATVVSLRQRETLLSKKQLAAELDRSPRWVEQRHHDGLPIHSTDRYGHRRYSLEAVQAWLVERPVGRVELVDRVAALEARMAELEARR